MTEAGLGIIEETDTTGIQSDLDCARRLLALAVSALKTTGRHTGTIMVIEDWLEESK